jgi:hypothetical protein
MRLKGCICCRLGAERLHEPDAKSVVLTSNTSDRMPRIKYGEGHLLSPGLASHLVSAIPIGRFAAQPEKLSRSQSWTLSWRCSHQNHPNWAKSPTPGATFRIRFLAALELDGESPDGVPL